MIEAELGEGAICITSLSYPIRLSTGAGFPYMVFLNSLLRLFIGLNKKELAPLKGEIE